MKVSAYGDTSGHAKRMHTLQQISRQSLRWAEQALSACYIDRAEEFFLATVFDPR
jgi:hypothetical protein